MNYNAKITNSQKELSKLKFDYRLKRAELYKLKSSNSYNYKKREELLNDLLILKIKINNMKMKIRNETLIRLKFD